MSDSAKRRMADMRRRKREDGYKQITCWVDPRAAEILKYISKNSSLTQGEFISLLVRKAYDEHECRFSDDPAEAVSRE